MRPLLVSVPALWVGVFSAPLVAYLFLQSDLPATWRKVGAAVGIAGVAGLTIYYWNESMPVHAYGIMLAVAALVGISLGVARAPVAGFTRPEIVDLGLYCVLWGVVGARLFHVIERHELYFGPEGGIPRALAVWNGGLVFYGGMVGAMGYMTYWAFRYKDGLASVVRVFDLGAPCMMFGLAFGRIGCFLNGCCYGRPSSLPWAVQYKTGVWFAKESRFIQASHICQAIYTDGTRSSQWRGMMAKLDVPEHLTPVTYHVHPAQLYASVAVILVGLFTSWVFYRRARPGWVSVSLLLTYPVVRFILEGWFRGDTGPAFPSISGWLTIAQYVGILGFAAGLAWLGVMLYTGRREMPGSGS